LAIPEYSELMQPVLHALAQTNSDLPFVLLMNKVGSLLGLKADERTMRLPSGSDTVLANRLRWALTYLERSGVVEVSDGHYRCARAGCPIASAASSLDAGTAPVNPCKPVARPRQATTIAAEVIKASAHIIHEQLKSELLVRIHAEPPAFFERLVIELLLAMGYGCRRDLVGHLGRSGDGGIDGAVPQDVLGLDIIYVQAKRYRPNISVPVSAVREFAGSLDACKARKGVFVTTAAIPNSARKFVSAVPSRIVLIDGPELAELLVGHNIGVKLRKSYEVKEIDEGYLAEALHWRAES
jgi:restriction system protein